MKRLKTRLFVARMMLSDEIYGHWLHLRARLILLAVRYTARRVKLGLILGLKDHRNRRLLSKYLLMKGIDPGAMASRLCLAKMELEPAWVTGDLRHRGMFEVFFSSSARHRLNHGLDIINEPVQVSEDELAKLMQWVDIGWAPECNRMTLLRMAIEDVEHFRRQA